MARGKKGGKAVCVHGAYVLLFFLLSSLWVTEWVGWILHVTILSGQTHFLHLCIYQPGTWYKTIHEQIHLIVHGLPGRCRLLLTIDYSEYVFSVFFYSSTRGHIHVPGTIWHLVRYRSNNHTLAKSIVCFPHVSILERRALFLLITQYSSTRMFFGTDCCTSHTSI